MAALVCLGAGAASPDDLVESDPSPETPDTARIVLERVIDGQAIARSGGKLVRWITGSTPNRALERPYGIAWDGDDLIVTDPGAGRVIRISRKNKVKTSPAAVFDTPIGVAVCPSGIVVTDARLGRVTLLDHKLRRVRDLADGLERPTGVACAESRVYVIETGAHRILALDPSRHSDPGIDLAWGRRGSGPGEFNFPA
ncbi:unnamed protein product, partial [marine sediment metagenome]